MRPHPTGRHSGVVFLTLGALAVFALSQCRQPQQGVILTKEQREQIKEHVFTKAPTVASPLNANLGNRVRLVGVEVDKNEVRPGEKFTITYWWESLKPAKGDWMVFVHLESPGKKRQTLDHHPVGELYPINRWNPGEFVRDVQQVTLDNDFPPGEALMYVGVFNWETWQQQQANDRFPLVNAKDVPNDGDHRVRALRITVRPKTGGPAATSAAPATPAQLPKVPRLYRIYKALGPIQIDGKLDEDTWKQVGPSHSFAAPDRAPLHPQFRTAFKAAWDGQFLYVAFDVRDNSLWAGQTARDGTLWEEDAVEVYLDPGSDQKDYVELQVAPTNVLFDAHFSAHRSPGWQEAAARMTADIRTAVAVDGSVNKGDDGVTDNGYVVEMAIPWSALPGIVGPPAAGSSWTANFFRIDAKGPKQVQFQGAWAPVGGDFHNLVDAGTLTFVDEPAAGQVPTRRDVPPAGAMAPPGGAAPVAAPAAPSAPPGGTAPPAAPPASPAAAPAASPAPPAAAPATPPTATP